jgi:hypothetical protein
VKDPQRKSEAPQFLSGWKEIANYLGKGVRTVQRYERELGLPVRRPAGKPWGSVVATKAELDAWVEASPIRQAFSLARPQQEAQRLATTTALKAGMAEMVKLRDQMMALRAEVSLSVQLLQESVYALQGDLSQNNWSEVASRIKLVDAATDKNTLVLLKPQLKVPKAN